MLNDEIKNSDSGATPSSSQPLSGALATTVKKDEVQFLKKWKNKELKRKAAVLMLLQYERRYVETLRLVCKLIGRELFMGIVAWDEMVAKVFTLYKFHAVISDELEVVLRWNPLNPLSDLMCPPALENLVLFLPTERTICQTLPERYNDIERLRLSSPLVAAFFVDREKKRKPTLDDLFNPMIDHYKVFCNHLENMRNLLPTKSFEYIKLDKWLSDLKAV